jgi:hypothetical protein
MRPMIARESEPLDPSVKMYVLRNPERYWILRKRVLRRKLRCDSEVGSFAAVELVRCMMEHPSMAKWAMIRE